MSLLKFTLTGAGELDGDYDVTHFPSTRELIAYRKDADLTPAELQEVFEEGGMEQLPLFAWVVHFRAGKRNLARAVLDLPYDLWSGIETEEPEGEGEPEDPTNASASG